MYAFLCVCLGLCVYLFVNDLCNIFASAGNYREVQPRSAARFRFLYRWVTRPPLSFLYQLDMLSYNTSTTQRWPGQFMGQKMLS